MVKTLISVVYEIKIVELEQLFAENTERIVEHTKVMEYDSRLERGNICVTR